MGGEKRQARTYTASCQGSPPHGRGKARMKGRAAAGQRITPAWAGKRSICCCASPAPTDHPRMGGEKHSRAFPPNNSLGSPPHGRGKGGNISAQTTGQRITPAWAGKSVEQKSTPFLFRDHPRMGGEKSSASTRFFFSWGSPPHGRGKGPSSQGLRALRGSPPHGRGKDEKLKGDLDYSGITPAWAGKR